MPIFRYKKSKATTGFRYEYVSRAKLAGWNLIHAAWRARGCKDGGWSISPGKLVGDNSETILFDYKPSLERYSSLAVLDVEMFHVFTYTDDVPKGKARWSVVMPHMHELSLPEDRSLTWRQRDDLLWDFEAKHSDPVFEFLYLNGDDKSWNWGKVGTVNAALLYKDALDYFLPIINGNHQK